jgi:riboflavin transporter FmnP
MQNNQKKLITISMLSAVAFILTFLKFPIPFLPPYLTLDISDVPGSISDIYARSSCWINR